MTLPLDLLDPFGDSLVNAINSVAPLSLIVAFFSSIACLVVVYIMGLLYRWSWRLTAAFAALALALNAATPFVTTDPPWLSTLAVVLANLFGALVLAIRLREERLCWSAPKPKPKPRKRVRRTQRVARSKPRPTIRKRS